MNQSRTVPLGSSGIEVSDVFYGAGSIGGIGSAASTLGLGISASEGLAQLEEARSRGVRVIDTANSYAAGESERVVGEWLTGHDDALVATKVGSVVEPGQQGVDLSVGHIKRQAEASLSRLGRIDLYLTHATDTTTPVVETLEAFTSLIEDGHIRGFGWSNVTARDLERLLEVADASGLRRPGWVQNSYNLADRRDERDVFPVLRSEGLGYTPFSPLAGGVLSDRYLDGVPPAPGSRLDVAGAEYAYAYTEKTLGRVAKLSRLAARLGVSTAGLALAWLRWNPVVTAPIVSPRSGGQWTAVDEALGLDLDDADAEAVGRLFPKG